MKKICFVLISVLTLAYSDCFGQKTGDRNRIKIDTVSVDSLTYELIIFDPGFDAWLAVQHPKNFQTKEYYELKNRFYVQEWNNRYLSSKNDGLYGNFIDYRPATDYGLDLNYRLYYYFRFFEERNKITLVPPRR
jgi:hypothetical protein